MNQSVTTHSVDHQVTAPLTPLKGLLVLLGIIVVIGGFIALCAALGIHEFWVAFLFLLYWGGIEHVAFDKLPSCVVGAVVGLVMAWLLYSLPGWFGDAGGVIFLALILALIYCQVMGWLPVAVNLIAMLFLTAGTIPAVQNGVNFADAFVALGLSFIYFIGLVWVGTRVMVRRQQQVASETGNA